jgi:hypothetical protein
MGLVILVVIGSMTTYSTVNDSEIGFTARADTNQTLSQMWNTINQTKSNITMIKDLVQQIYTVLGTLNLSNAHTNLFKEILEIQHNISDLNFSTDNTSLVFRLDMIENALETLTLRMGYNESSNPNVFNVKADFDRLYNALYFTEDGLHFFPVLKDSSGKNTLKTIGDNQIALGNKSDNIVAKIDTATEDINDHASAQAGILSSNIGGVNTFVIIILILLIIFLLWVAVIKPRYFPSYGEPPKSEFEGAPPWYRAVEPATGRPTCFGDENTFNPEQDKQCQKCQWMNKCEATVMRRETPDLEIKRDVKGNVVEITDDGEPIELPGCFGKEFDPSNPDCMDCLVNKHCTEQLEMNRQMPQITIPPMRPQRQQQPQPTGQRVRGAAGLSAESVLGDF